MIYRNWLRNKPLKEYATYGDGHWSKFEQFRRRHNENVCLETNKLVLRLDKIINLEDATNPNIDKTVVEWTSDDLVKLCPFCAKSFTIARRRHHCRACGAILCSTCSKFLDYPSASKLVKPAKLYTDPFDRIQDRLEGKDAEKMPSIRCCEDCKRLLDRRIQLIEDYHCQPSFLDFYNHLRHLMREADDLILSHKTLVQEKKQPDADLKAKIQDLKHKIATKSAKLKKMIDRESGKQAYLLASTNQSVACWLKESLESKCNRLYGLRPKNATSSWVPEHPSLSSTQDMDLDGSPLLIQIRNLQKFIKQARAAGRYEEVSALEENKRDLEIEYLIQQDLSIATDESLDMESLNGKTIASDDDGDKDREKMTTET